MNTLEMDFEEQDNIALSEETKQPQFSHEEQVAYEVFRLVGIKDPTTLINARKSFVESLAFFEGGVLLNEKKEKKMAARAAFFAGLSAKKRAKYLAMLQEESDTESESDEEVGKTKADIAEEAAPNLLKRIAGAVAGTAKDFAEANKAPKLGN
ncbi:hypothetical protein CYMTET_46319 [Cymbomonas tetramitiformis]|uniref:Uncharacterized protein n=1 Tax=Cymbomonas tetramitiformis TaxID=36881 RepID=A0AAE0EX65_9CHLO|nr:hypothetical protein CYMTET_46319 [Cymbomonas tetramitiformis]